MLLLRHRLDNRKMTATNNMGPQINPTANKLALKGGILLTVLYISVKIKLKIIFDDNAPKASQGSIEPVSELFGSKTAGASSHKTYQCWNQNDPTNRYSKLVKASVRHNL